MNLKFDRKETLKYQSVEEVREYSRLEFRKNGDVLQHSGYVN